MPEAPRRRLEDHRVSKPWGYELRFAITDRYLGKLIHVHRGEMLSLQFHERKDETILMMQGRMDLQLEGDNGAMQTSRLVPGDVVHIAPRRKHRMVAVEDCEFFEVSSPELDDVIRIEDKYGREGTRTG